MVQEADQMDMVLLEAEQKMQKAVEALEHDLTTIRTGRASTGLVDRLPVEYYGSEMPLNQIAGINAPEARLIVIQPWDKSAIPAIEKAIQKSELGLTPSNDGTVIRIAVPQLTEERRRDLVKLVHRRVEECRVAIRNVRRDAHDQLRKLRKENQATEDDLKQGEVELQKITDRSIAEADRVGKDKEEEVMAV
ncbi:MAG TPA: ribosome recycling factor [Chloroflexota bacterium]|nr:ribosome recycling factor [Chloroflexota bacterium]